MLLSWMLSKIAVVKKHSSCHGTTCIFYHPCVASVITWDRAFLNLIGKTGGVITRYNRNRRNRTFATLAPLIIDWYQADLELLHVSGPNRNGYALLHSVQLPMARDCFRCQGRYNMLRAPNCCSTCKRLKAKRVTPEQLLIYLFI
jgi:hypothetical protein